MRSRIVIPSLVTAVLALACVPAWSQAWRELGAASHVIVPQQRGWSLDAGRRGIQVEGVRAHVKIVAQTATTTLEVAVMNPGSRQAEAVLLLPVPDGAVVSSFLFEGSAAEPTAQLMGREEARRVYNSIVSKLRDPALLEFAGYNLIRSSVFPVPASGRQRVRVTYEQVLPAEGNRIDYVLPRSESLSTSCPWDISVEIHSKDPVSMVYSPSHDLITDRAGRGRLSVRVADSSRLDLGSFFFTYLLERSGVTASLFAYPEPEIGGGYFLLLAGLPAAPIAQSIKREVTLVIDRSGSMAGTKMDQVRAAALQIIEGLADGESFNIIDYATAVELFAPAAVVKSRETTLAARQYLAAIRTTGGTNIHAALVESLRQKPTPDALPIVLFLTDGLPTVGNTSEVDIAKVIETGNPHLRRVFSFGVGADVNAPLLDRIADRTRGTSTYVMPGEDVEVKVAAVFRKLYGPVLSAARLEALDAAGAVTTRRVRARIPVEIPDLFDGDQLVLLGQYVGEEPLQLRLSGNYLGAAKAFDFTLGVDTATTRNAFVPRLWASRRIALLVDEIRQAGAAEESLPLGSRGTLASEPRYQELVDEILRLSTKFGILSEYTSFLATEGTDLSDWKNLQTSCGAILDNLAVKTRFGLPAVSQAQNYLDKKSQTKLNYRNDFLDEKLERVSFSAIQQVGDRAFLQQGGRWIDSRLIVDQEALEPDETVTFGSPEHLALVTELARQGRQGMVALSGEILMRHGDKNVLVVGDHK